MKTVDGIEITVGLPIFCVVQDYFGHWTVQQNIVKNIVLPNKVEYLLQNKWNAGCRINTVYVDFDKAIKACHKKQL